MRLVSPLAVVFLVSTVAHADLVGFVSDPLSSPAGDQSLGAFTGSVDLQAQPGGVGSLTIELTNLSQLGGRITGIAFGGVGLEQWVFDANASVGLGPDWANPDAILNVNPFGQRDFGAILGRDSWQGNGSPAGGIAAGATATFVFTGLAVEAESAADLLVDWNFLVRIRGFENGESDKLAATIVPAPAGLGLVVMSGLVPGRRRRRRNLR